MSTSEAKTLPGDLLLRPATAADAPAVRELVFAVLREHGLPPDPDHTDADLSDFDAHYYRRGGRFDVLTAPGGPVVGCVGLYPLDATTCELRKMYLHPAARGQGWGRYLLDHALAQACARGFTRVVLETATVLAAAIRLYERAGFRPQPLDRAHCSCRCDRAYALDLRGTCPNTELTTEDTELTGKEDPEI